MAINDSELYLTLFSYMPVSDLPKSEQCGYRILKLTAYIPIVGTIANLFVGVSQLISAEEKEGRVFGAFHLLRAALSLSPPLLLLTELVTTVVDAILRAPIAVDRGNHHW